MSRSVVLTTEEWTPTQLKTLPPKVNDRGGKSIGLISLETNRALQLSTPMMTTWGISDFVDKETGESDGKYSMSLQFPNGEYKKPATDTFLEKLKEFETKIIDEAVAKSEFWFDEVLSREVLKHNFFPFLKYSKNKDTKKIDPTKAPTLKCKVPYYDSKWGVEIYDTNKLRIFPSEDPNLTPLDFVPKQSKVACVLQCGGIWIGGKGWGVTWKVSQTVVTPRQNMSIAGKCHVFLSEDDRVALESAPAVSAEDDEEYEETTTSTPNEVKEPMDTSAPDSDDDETSPAVAATAVKKVMKKADVPVVVTSSSSAPSVKKIVKKKVVTATA
jgi:hypothetical protein